MKPNSHCNLCNKEIYAKPSLLALGRNHYCSKDCYQKARYGEKVDIHCRVCNKLITSTASKNHLPKYCSRSCSNKGRLGIKYGTGQLGSNNVSLKIRRELLIDKFGEVCLMCGIGPVWNGKPLSLQVDHMNGIHKDNRIENLRLLCPNCHSQTENYAGKNRKKK